MDPTAAAFASWRLEPVVLIALLTAGIVYLRGWRRLRRTMPARFPVRRLVGFQAGLAAIAIAICSPLDAFASLLLQVHMAQHLLLTMVAPPLLWFGWPDAAILRGLPGAVAREIAPLRRAPLIAAALGFLTHPAVGWLGLALATWLWHVPALYELALRSPDWHQVEHASLLGAALLFWRPVLQPWPVRPAWPRWTMVPYLALGDLQNTALAAILCFSNRVLYPTYEAVPRLWGSTALGDQIAAGAFMWVVGSIAYLLPLGAIVVALLAPRRSTRAVGAGSELRDPWHDTEPSRTAVSAADRERCRPLPSPGTGEGRGEGDEIASPHNSRRAEARPESLRRSHLIPLTQSLSRSGRGVRQAPGSRESPRESMATPHPGQRPSTGGGLRRLAEIRPALQAVALVLAAIVVADGLLGPRLAPMNLAGVLPWTYWRAFAVLGLLVAGNVFCMACPLTMARDLARSVLPARWTWPRWLRTKWLAVALLGLYLWAYEAFDVWDDPRATAFLVLAYFATAIAIDGLFRGASFCKYVCPIGQYHFVLSLASPLEITAREPQVCRGCTTRDCVRGNAEKRGCELELFLPEKVGNLDCTFCLDCVSACPHDNVGLTVGLPGRTLLGDPHRSSIGRLSQRPDVAAVSLAVVFGAFVNAAGMVAPVTASSAALGLTVGGERIASSILFLVGMALIPVALVAACAWLSQRVSRSGLVALASRFGPTLVPLGLALWSAHLLFHLAGGAWTAIPVLQRAAQDVGVLTATPVWAMGAASASSLEWLQPTQILLLDGGFLLSLHLGWRSARELDARRSSALFAPWGVLASALWIAGVWLLLQPMEMRGMLH